METLFIGKNTIFLPETESTNSYATQLLKNVNPPEGTIIHTTNQTLGKAQRGKLWNAEPDCNLTLSLIIKPEFLKIEKQFLLYQIAALACHDTIAENLNTSHFDIKIKWPNDILVNGKKVCGILIENNVIGNTINASVIGIGLNINQTQFENLPNATSLKVLGGSNFSMETIMKELARNFEKYYLALKRNDTTDIEQNYLVKLHGLGEWHNYERNGFVLKCMILGVGKNGLLRLKTSGGNSFEADIKEITYLF